MSRSILVPYHGSQQSKSALQLVSEVFPGWDVTVLHVVDPMAVPPDADQPATERYAEAYEHAQALLADADQQLAGHAGDVATEFIYRHPVHAILRYADLYTFDQLAIGTDGDGEETAGPDTLGPVADAVVQRAATSVTVVPAAPDDGAVAPPASVLVPFDGSPLSRGVLAYAIETCPEATVHVRYVDYPYIDDVDRAGVRSSDHPRFEAWHDAVCEWHADAERDPASVLQLAESVADEAERAVQTAVAGDPRLS